MHGVRRKKKGKEKEKHSGERGREIKDNEQISWHAQLAAWWRGVLSG
jgi:hypothetical protein